MAQTHFRMREIVDMRAAGRLDDLSEREMVAVVRTLRIACSPRSLSTPASRAEAAEILHEMEVSLEPEYVRPSRRENVEYSEDDLERDRKRAAASFEGLVRRAREKMLAFHLTDGRPYTVTEDAKAEIFAALALVEEGKAVVLYDRVARFTRGRVDPKTKKRRARRVVTIVLKAVPADEEDQRI